MRAAVDTMPSETRIRQQTAMIMASTMPIAKMIKTTARAINVIASIIGEKSSLGSIGVSSTAHRPALAVRKRNVMARFKDALLAGR